MTRPCVWGLQILCERDTKIDLSLCYLVISGSSGRMKLSLTGVENDQSKKCNNLKINYIALTACNLEYNISDNTLTNEKSVSSVNETIFDKLSESGYLIVQQQADLASLLKNMLMRLMKKPDIINGYVYPHKIYWMFSYLVP